MVMRDGGSEEEIVVALFHDLGFVVCPDNHGEFSATLLANYVSDQLVVYPEQMLKNLNQFGGLVFSQRLLLVLTQKEVSREESYKVVQKNAMLAWESYGSKDPLIFEELVKKDEFITSTLTKKEIEDIFDLKYHIKNIDNIFKRVLEK